MERSPVRIGQVIRGEYNSIKEMAEELEKEYMNVFFMDEGYYASVSFTDKILTISGIKCIHFLSSDKKENNIYLTFQAYRDTIEAHYNEDLFVAIEDGRLHYSFEEKDLMQRKFEECPVCGSLCQEINEDEDEWEQGAKVYSCPNCVNNVL